MVLRDAAHLQEEDARHARAGGYSQHDPPLPLLRQRGRRARDRPARTCRLGPVGGHARRCDGHAATARGTSSGRRFAVVERAGAPGAVQRRPRPAAPPAAAAAGAACRRSTWSWSSRRTATGRTSAVDRERLGRPITATARRGGVDARCPRSPWTGRRCCCTTLAGLIRDGLVPRLPVYVDSPMALTALEVYRRAVTDQDPADSAGPASTARTRSIPAGSGWRTPRQSPSSLNDPHDAVHHHLGLGDGHRRTGPAPPARISCRTARNTVLLTGFQVGGHPRPCSCWTAPRR